MEINFEKLKEEYDKYCEQLPMCKCSYCGHEVPEIYAEAHKYKCTRCFIGRLIRLNNKKGK